MKFNWNQVAIAFGLFLLGYLTFNNPWFGSKEPAAPVRAPAATATAPAPASTAPASTAPASTATPAPIPTSR